MTRTTALLTTLVVFAACSSGRPDVQTEPVRPDETRQTPPSTASTEELEALEAIYRARTDSARLTVSEADVEFMTGMIAHHAQALVMSRLAPSHGASDEMLVLTGRIINAQNDEIATMSGWLAERGRHVPEIEIDGVRLLIDGHEHSMDMSMHMPGMLSREQLRELDEARGPDFDRLFLTFMIQHHNGAVQMVHQLFATDGAAQDGVTFKLASDIQVDQITEVARMESMLEEMAKGGGPFF